MIKTIYRFFDGLYLSNRFFAMLFVIVLVMGAGFALPVLLPVGQTLLVVALAATLFDIFLLFNKRVNVDCGRRTPKVLSLSDEQNIYLDVANRSGLNLEITLIDELPEQFQERDFELEFSLDAHEERTLIYTVRPLTRGSYVFESVNIFLTSVMGIVNRRIRKRIRQAVPVYPSILQMRKYELMIFSQVQTSVGIKRMRRLGQSYEFEQIKHYVQGDDFRSINWKATSRRNELMVNQFEDERSQQVYSVIDKSRAMRMPFEGLSLLDYAINTSLVISNVALRKGDKAGLLTFSDKIGAMLRADKRPIQLRRILEQLYKEEERKQEANYELLYLGIRNMIRGRSLLVLYTNFESMYALERVLPILRRINRLHLLVVMVFENTEIEAFSKNPAGDVQGIYNQTIAFKFIEERKQMISELRKSGIQAMLTRPEDLSINTINKYLELKARGMI